jgi:PST family polysaccharide transporter
VTERTASRQRAGAHQNPFDIPASGEFKRKSVRGGAANVFGQGFGMALQIGTTVVLARLLSPTDYGLQAMVVTLTSFFSLFKDAGLSIATIQRETLTHEQISTLFWINVTLGSLLTIVVAAMGPLLARFYRDPRLLWLTVACSTVFLFSGLAVQHRALLDRSMRFTSSVKIDILSSTVGSIVAISMAALGFGYWSLICQTISLSIVGAVAVWIAMPWLPGRPRWSPEVRSMVRFGGTVSLNSVVVYVAYNTEKVLLGRFWGAAPLGLYTRAYQLATLPVQQLTGAVHSVAFSALSRMQNEAHRLQRAYLKSLSLIVSLTIPVVIGSALFAREIVLVVLGQKWIEVAPIFRLLAPTVLVLALVNPFAWLLQATGRVERSLKIAFLICPVVILGIVAGLHRGPTGVAFGYSSAMVLLFVPIVAWATHGTGITAGAYWDSIKRPLLSGAIGGGAGWLVQVFFQATLAPISLLVLELTISFAVYAGLLLFAMGQQRVYADLLSHLFQRKQALEGKSQE